MKQNKKKSGIGTRLLAFILLGAMVLSAVVATVVWFQASI